MAKKIIKPLKGLDLDSAVNRINDDSIRMARNLRVNNKEVSHVGEYTNVKGINEAIQVNDGRIVGHTKVDDDIVLIISGPWGADLICRVSENEIPKNGEGILTLDNTKYYWESTQGAIYHKVFSGDLNLSSNSLNIKSYYESEDVKKVYWTKPGEVLRSINIVKTEYNDPSLLTTADLEAVPSVDLTTPEFTKIISGSLLTGKIFYAYKLINNNGAETNLSDLSAGVHLTKSSDSLSNDYTYRGYGFDVDSGKGVNLKISNISDSFSKAKVYSIHFLDDVSLPVIKLIYNAGASGDLRISDTGVALSEISAEEFIEINNLILSDGILEIKNNRLFVANYDEELFDIDDFAAGGYWDARAYRFNAQKTSRECSLYESDLVNYLNLEAASPAYDSVPVEYDCINKSNSLTYASPTFNNNDYFQTDKATIGSDGKNITITQSFDSRAIYPDWASSPIEWYSPKTSEFTDALSIDGYASYSNPSADAYYRTFKLEETYRLGIQFKSGRQLSAVKWISDYKVAYDDSDDTVTKRYSSARMKMKPVSLKFGLRNIPIDPTTGDPFEFRIMYVPVTEADQGVFWGIFNPLYKSSSDSKFKVRQLTHDIENSSDIGKYLDFVSSEYCLGNRKTYSHARVYKKCLRGSIDYDGDADRNFHINKVYDFIDDTNSLLDVDSQYDLEYSSNIDADVPLGESDVFSRKTACKFFNDAGEQLNGSTNKGRSQIIRPETPLGSSENETLFGYCYADVFESQYGGLSYQSRKNSGYVPLSPFMNNTYEAVYGDSFLSIFEYLRLIAENGDLTVDGPDSDIGNPEFALFPTITRANLTLRSDILFSKKYTTDGSYLIHEYAGVHEDNSLINSSRLYIYTQDTDMYLYNKTYSREQDLLKYYEKSSSTSITDKFPNRISSSDYKILGEQEDSFLKISPNTYIDTDGAYGEITALITFKDRLYFFQEKAIGIVAVNERSQTLDSSGNAISIGETGVLSRYDYITTEFGLHDKTMISATDNAIYFCDEVKQEFLAITSNGLSRLSVVSSVDSFVKSIDLSKVIIIPNRNYNEVLFTYRDSGYGTQDALVYSEITKSFSSILDINLEPLGSENIDREDLFDQLVTSISQTELASTLFTLNDGNYNEFNGSNIPSEITFAINPGNEKNVLFNMVEFVAKDSSGDFLDTIRIYNDNYDTGEMLFSTSVNSRFGKYRTSKLRGYVVPGKKERILDNNINVTIKTKDNSTAQDRVWFRDFIATYSEYNYFG